MKRKSKLFQEFSINSYLRQFYSILKLNFPEIFEAQIWLLTSAQTITNFFFAFTKIKFIK